MSLSMNAVSASRSNGHLRRCQSALRAHVRTSTFRAQGLLPPCIWPLLRDLQGACGRIDIRALGALRFLNRLQHPKTGTGSWLARVDGT